MASAIGRRILFRFDLPDGPHLAVHTTFSPMANADDALQVHNEIQRAVGMNPDAEIDFNSLQVIPLGQDQVFIEKAVTALRAENPERPLASDLGLDRMNRLLTNPEIARQVAGANQLRHESGDA